MKRLSHTYIYFWKRYREALWCWYPRLCLISAKQCLIWKPAKLPLELRRSAYGPASIHGCIVSKALRLGANSVVYTFQKIRIPAIGQFSTSLSIFIHPLHIPKSAKFLLWSLKPFNFKFLAVATINNILRSPKKNTNGACLIGKGRTSPNTSPCYWCIHFSIGFTRLPQFFLSSLI